MRLLHLALAAVLALSYGIASAQTGTTAAAGAPTIVTMDDTKWMPGTGMMKGLQVAVLSGDPTKSGPYVVRLRIPANTTLPPHYHGEAENVTVISGAHQLPAYLAEHQAMAAHSLRGKHLIAEKGAHWVHLDQPELIVEAFCEMAEKLKAESIAGRNRK